MQEDAGGLFAPRKRKRPELTPIQRALALLVRREHSRRELARKLAERGIEQEAALAAIERLVVDGWQSDARFAGMLVRTRVAQGQGPVRIRAELGTHGLDSSTVDAALGTFEGDWRQVAQDVARRRFGPEVISVDMAQRRKMADFLYRRGFDSDMVWAAFKARPED